MDYKKVEHVLCDANGCLAEGFFFLDGDVMLQDL